MENVNQTISKKCCEISRIKVKMNDDVQTYLSIACNSISRQVMRNVYRQIFSNLSNKKYD